MSYTTDTKVRDRANLDTSTPGSTEVTDFIAKAETELGNLIGIALGSAVHITNISTITDFVPLSGHKTVEQILIDYDNIDEIQNTEMLSNPNVEETVDDEPDAWTDTAATGDTLSHDSTYSFIWAHSLKISKGGSSASYWYSDAKAINTSIEYRGTCRVKVDSNTSANTYLKLEFLDVDGSVTKTVTSPAASLEITQPAAAATTKAVSSSTSDTTQTVTIFGIVNGLRDSETIELNGTSSVSGTKTFSEILSIKKPATAGTVTIKDASDNTLASLTASQTVKNEWIELKVDGSPTSDAVSARLKFYVDSSSGSAYADRFTLRKKNWFIGPDGVYFTRNITGTVEVRYTKSEVETILEEMVRDLTALYCILYANGMKTGGIRYTDLKSAGYNYVGESRLYNAILKDFENSLERYISRNNNAFIVGRFG